MKCHCIYVNLGVNQVKALLTVLKGRGLCQECSCTLIRGRLDWQRDSGAVC